MNETDDESIMLSVQEGNLDRLSLLFERYSGMLFSFFMKRVQEHGQSEDLTQEVFLRILRYRRTFKSRGPGSFRSWLFSIARNLQTRQWNRRFSRLHVLSDDLKGDAHLEPVDNAMRPDDKAELNEETDLLYRALEMLPDEKRQLVVMRRIQNLSYAEMADSFECEVNTLKVRVHRAVAELATQLKSLMKDGSYEMPRM